MTPSSAMYGRLARYYDLVYASKDYAREVRELRALVQRYGKRPAHSWLDVACGTGRHLELLRRYYRVTGVDLSPAMLRVARRRLPGVRLFPSNMESLRLGERFDVVSCLFSAIGYLRTRAALARAFAAFVRHLEPGGVLLIDPWIEPSRFIPGHVSIDVERTDRTQIARASDSHRSGDLTHVRFQYLIAERGHQVVYRRETETLRLTSRAEFLRLARLHGLTPYWLRKPWSNARGRLVAVAPLERRGGGVNTPGA